MRNLQSPYLALAICFSLAATAQVPGTLQRVLYDTGIEQGDLSLRQDGVLEWRTPGQSPVFLLTSLDLGRDLLWLGTGRRFLVAGFHSPLSQGRILLVELSSTPPRIQVLATASGGMDIASVLYKDTESTLYALDITNAAIRKAPYNAASNSLPGFSNLELVVDAMDLPLLERRLGLQLGNPFAGQDSGVTLCDIVTPERPCFRIENHNGSWSVAAGPPEPLERWTWVTPYIPSQGPLIAYVPSRAYTIVRLDVSGKPEAVSGGDFGPVGEDPPIGQTAALNLPPGGLVPGGRYFIDQVEVNEGNAPTALPSLGFTPLFRSGSPLGGAGVKMWLGRTSGRSELGSTDFSAAVYLNWVGPSNSATVFDLFLYWSLADQNGQPPIAGFGNTALLTNPLGVFTRKITLSQESHPSRYVTVPLTDPRLTIGDLMYFQFALAVNASTVVLSDVFATTIFEPLVAQSKAPNGGFGLTSAQGRMPSSISDLGPLQREVWERARDLLRAKKLIDPRK